MTIADGMVAENSIVWRSSGVWARMRSTSGRKPEVEHLVGLVEHEHLDVAEIENPAVGQVEQSARGADDHVDAAAELVELILVADAAVDGEHSGLPASRRPC